MKIRIKTSEEEDENYFKVTATGRIEGDNREFRQSSMGSKTFFREEGHMKMLKESVRMQAITGIAHEMFEQGEKK